MTDDNKKKPDEDLKDETGKLDSDFQLPPVVPFELPPVEPIDLPKYEPVDLSTFEMPDLTGMFTPTEKQPPKQPNATAKEIAAWMKTQVTDEEYLYQEHTAYQIEEEFGDKFIYTNDNGNRAIAKAVLIEFRKLTPDLVWSRSGYYWRKREEDDDPKKRQVD